MISPFPALRSNLIPVFVFFYILAHDASPFLTVLSDSCLHIIIKHYAMKNSTLSRILLFEIPLFEAAIYKNY